MFEKTTKLYVCGKNLYDRDLRSWEGEGSLYPEILHIELTQLLYTACSQDFSLLPSEKKKTRIKTGLAASASLESDNLSHIMVAMITVPVVIILVDISGQAEVSNLDPPLGWVCGGHQTVSSRQVAVDKMHLLQVFTALASRQRSFNFISSYRPICHISFNKLTISVECTAKF